MFQTLFLNTFGSLTRVKWCIPRKYNDTALSRRYTMSHGNSILNLTSQNTLTKTSVWHFPITYEAVSDTFMLDTNHRNTLPSFSRPHTSIDSRYTNICNFKVVLQLGLQTKTWFILEIFENNFNNVSKCLIYIKCADYLSAYTKVRK